MVGIQFVIVIFVFRNCCNFRICIFIFIIIIIYIIIFGSSFCLCLWLMLRNKIQYFDLLFVKSELNWTMRKWHFNFCINITSFIVIDNILVFILKFSGIKVWEFKCFILLPGFVLITFNLNFMLHPGKNDAIGEWRWCTGV